ncbi:MAG: hypothetical protein RL095_266 [Verrucomicrobiota bacterium]
MKSAKQQLSSPRVVLVEGDEEVNALVELTKGMGYGKEQLCIYQAEGKDNFRSIAFDLADGTITGPSLTHLLVLADADSDPKASRQALSDLGRDLQVRFPELVYASHILPETGPGSLEALLLHSLKPDEGKPLQCAPSFSSCVGGNEAQQQKTLFYATLLAQGRAPVANRGLLQQHCDLAHPCWEPLKVQIRELMP